MGHARIDSELEVRPNQFSSVARKKVELVEKEHGEQSAHWSGTFKEVPQLLKLGPYGPRHQRMAWPSLLC
jgi:hypothetical protein